MSVYANVDGMNIYCKCSRVLVHVHGPLHILVYVMFMLINMDIGIVPEFVSAKTECLDSIQK